MPTPYSDSASAHGNRERTRVACRRCNSRKVKCNAQHGVPCKGCLSANTECIPIDSQRGRYLRKANQAKDGRRSTTQSSSGIHHTEPGPASTVHQELEPDAPFIPENRVSNPFERAFDTIERDCDRRFYLHIADQGVSSTAQPISSQKSTLFLGESFSLTYVVHDVLAPFLSAERAPSYRKRLHFPIDEGFDPSDRGQQDIVDAQAKLLQSRNLLFQPNQGALKRLLAGYFRWFHPAFPVLDRAGFIRRCGDNQLSLLVLNAVLMIAVTVCDDVDLAILGIADRYEARELFYRQTRALYESDSDPDKTNNIVAVFLMSFWWGGPNDQKDSWYWLGIAVGSAQSLGMHRSTLGSHMPSHTVRLWRRIWWCLRVRDALVSGSIGRPQHFSVYDCDVEMLEPQDLDGEFESEPEIHYACQMARLSTIFSNIVASRYAAIKPDNPTQKKAQLEKDFEEFRSQIPSSLTYCGLDTSVESGLWAAMLLMAYNFGVILLCRPPHSNGQEISQHWGNHSKALAAANEVTRVMEDILSVSMGRACQIHTIPALFNSLAMHVFTICTSRAIGRELAENRTRVCMLGLTSLQESWPVSGWILRLFVYIMDRLKSMSKSLDGIGNTSNPQSGQPPSGTGLGDRSRLQADASGANTPGHRQHQMNMPNAFQTSLSSPLVGNFFEGSGFFPDMFVLDGFSENQENFFDFLRVPDWDNISTSFSL